LRIKNLSIDINKAQKVWRTVLNIPKGKVASYGQIADLAGLPGRARYVGRAMAYAPKNMKVPWYRVLRSNGQMAFEAGSPHAEQQKSLLQNEGVTVLKNRVDLKIHGWKPELGELLKLES
jgi:methylated-DNA-protein-cysteine methyltransferase related protein